MRRIHVTNSLDLIAVPGGERRLLLSQAVQFPEGTQVSKIILSVEQFEDCYKHFQRLKQMGQAVDEVVGGKG